MEFFESWFPRFTERLNKNNIVSIIASPSKGMIREDFDHIAIAETYFQHGADAVSVLTDVNFFKGKIEYLSDISGFKKAPLLRKDF